MKKNTRFLFWAAFSLIAFLPLLDIFFLPSSTEKAILFGLSAQRLIIAIFPLGCILFSMVMVILALIAPDRYKQTTIYLKRLASHNTLLTGILSFWVALFLGAILLYYRLAVAPNITNLTPKLGYLFPTLCAYFDRLWAVLMFTTFCIACWTIYVLFSLKQPIFQNTSMLIGIGAGVLCVFATLFQWVVFIFQLHIFEQIPGWYWPIILKPDFARNGILFSVFLLFFVFIIYFNKRSPRAYLLNLLLISLAFIGMQYLIGYLEGRGAASLTDRFFLSYHRIYIEEACNASVSPREAIIHYEDLYTSMFLQTKPPGVLWMSFKLTQAANSPVLSSKLDLLSKTITLSKFLPRMTSAACQRTMSLVTLLFPLLATSTIWVIYSFSKRLVGGIEYAQLAFYSAILYILAPNTIMLALFLDQAVYPTLFLLIASGTFYAMQKKSFMACFLVGATLYVAIFLSFSMLPLLVIPVIYFACTLWQENKAALIWANIKIILLPMGLGGLLSMLLFKSFLNYDILTRYQRMLTTRIKGDFYTRLDVTYVGQVTSLEKIRQTFNALILNNIELAVAIGFPIFIFFVLMGLRSLTHVIQRKPDKTAAINTSLFLTYVALNAAGAVLGEVGRLWLFWAPVMALLAVQYLLPIIRRSRWIIFALVILQFITVFLTYQFQDYLMPQLLP